jgi:hypothetical protein
MLYLCFATIQAQSPTNAKPPVTPQAAYEQATRPLEVTRRSPQNWSDVELAALKIATDQAKAYCLTSTPDQFTGEDLLAYARLCALGQEWEPVQHAASSYIEAKHPAPGIGQSTFAHSLATAFDYEVQASLRLQKPEAALFAAQTMLRTVPYDDLTSEATNSTVLYLQLSHTDEALVLLKQRQPILISMLRGQAVSKTPEDPRLHPALPFHSIYSDALALPTMQQFAGQPEASSSSYAELEGTLTANLSPDDAIYVAEGRRRYRLLGSRLPTISTFAWLLDPAGIGKHPQINSDFGSATVLLLFPDWCNQCVALHPTFLASWKRLRDDGVRFFALLAQAEAPPRTVPKEVTKTANKAAGSDSTTNSTRIAPFPGEKGDIPHVDLQLNVKSTAAALLVGTPTFVVPTETLDSFVANDFPLIIVADHDGIIRSIQVAPDNAMVPGGIVDQVADHVVHIWPPQQP